MKYRIYQPKEINFLVDENQVHYFKKDYKLTYKGEVNEKLAQEKSNTILEALFTAFNVAHPEDFKGHSLSTNDIVELDDNAWVCAPFGWNKINLV